MRWFILTVIFCGLTACGGGGSGSAGTGGPVTTDPDIIDRPLPDTDPVLPGNLPTTGRASFSGQLSLELAPTGTSMTIASPLSLAVDFGGTDAQVTGEAAGFSGFDGRLFLSLGQIDRAADGAQPAIAGRIAGTLKENTQSYLIFGTFDGDFRGSSQAAVSGRVAGSVLANNAQTPLTGSYQAGRLP